jgi:hypothetical protein
MKKTSYVVLLVIAITVMIFSFIPSNTFGSTEPYITFDGGAAYAGHYHAKFTVHNLRKGVSKINWYVKYPVDDKWTLIETVNNDFDKSTILTVDANKIRNYNDSISIKCNVLYNNGQHITVENSYKIKDIAGNTDIKHIINNTSYSTYDNSFDPFVEMVLGVGIILAIFAVAGISSGI